MSDNSDGLGETEAISPEAGNAHKIWQERLELFAVAIDVAEKLDELERRLDPEGEPPRHAALTHQRLRNMTRKMNEVAD